MIGDHRIRSGGECAEPCGGIRGHQSSHQRVCQCFKNVGYNDGIADGDAQRACQRQPSQQTADLPGRFAAGGPCVFVGPQRAGGCPASHGKLCGQTHIAENKNEQQINQQKGSAAVAAHFIGESPDVGHSYGRSHRCQNKAPAAGKALGISALFHDLSCLTDQPPLHWRSRSILPQNKKLPDTADMAGREAFLF